jgi:hypothetical protein
MVARLSPPDVAYISRTASVRRLPSQMRLEFADSTAWWIAVEGEPRSALPINARFDSQPYDLEDAADFKASAPPN